VIPPSVVAQFPAPIRARGRTYQEGGRVRITDASIQEIRATVLGSLEYTVQVRSDGGGFTFNCSCPYAGEHLACKHIWATLLEADRQGVLPGYPSDRHAEATRAAAPAANGAGPATVRASLRAWKRQLAAVRRQMGNGVVDTVPAPWPADRRLIYVIDLPTTQADGGLAVELELEREVAPGEWERPKQHRVSWEMWQRVPDPLDRQIAQMLSGARTDAGHYFAAPTARRFVIPAAAHDTTLRLICETGRARLRRVAGDPSPNPLAWDDGEPWRLHLRLVRETRGEAPARAGTVARCRVEGVLRRGDAERPLAAAALLTEAGVLILDDAVARFDHAGAFALVPVLRGEEPIVAPEDEVPELLRMLGDLPHLPPIDLPPELGIVETRPAPTFRLTVTAPGKARWPGESLLADLAFDYDGQIVPATTLGSAVVDATGTRVIHRDLAAERAAGERLLELGARREYDWGGGGGRRLMLPSSRLDLAVVALASEGWRVEADGVLYRHPGAFDAQLRSGIDWFELDAAVEFGDQRAPLPRLLTALRKGERTVRLDDGTLGIVPAEWLRQHAALAGLGTVAEDGTLRFGRAQTGLLDALLAALPETSVDETFERVRRELRGFAGVAPADPPPGFVGELRPYQRDGLGWLHFLRQFGVGGCLADDMGLGKTVQLLALLEERRAAGEGPSLVVVPKSLVFNWRQEAERFAPAMRVLDYTGVQRRRVDLADHDYDLVLTTYGTLRRDAAQFRAFEFDYVVLDEAQAIKNAATASAKAARLLRARHRLALSGTPVENRIDELWSLFEFLNPGMLGASAAFRAAGGGVSAAAPEARALLARAVRPFILRRTKDEVAADLPEKLEQTLAVELEPEQRALYDELRDHYRKELLGHVDRVGIKQSKIQILEALLRLRQAACHPGLIDAARAGEPSAKLDVLVPRVLEVVTEGHKVLVFSQFTSFLALVRTRLDAEGVVYEYLDGRTRDRQARVERFQTDPDCGVFLVSLKAGGVGLNLTAADYVFLLDPWWNPAVEAQAIDRTHRIGQTRSVFATRLIARDTVEERVVELQRSKRELADAILTADNGVIAGIGREDLELLLQ
jgi:hypothetical protein